MQSITRACVLVLVLVPAHGPHLWAQARRPSAAAQTARSWDQVLVEIHGLQADGKDAEATAVLDAYVKTRPKRWEPYVALAQDLEKQARYAAAADVLRAGRRSAPDMPALFALELVQYDVQQVTESPSLPRADAARALAEAIAVADELIKSKQQVRMAMLAKSYALQLQAERVEQNDARRQTLKAESDRLANESRFTNDDGSIIPKTASDEWLDLQIAAGDPPARPSGPALEKFVAAHPDFAPARISLATHYQALGDAITERTPAAAAARTKHYQAADQQLTRAASLATDPLDISNVLRAQLDLFNADRMNRPADALALARAALNKHPGDPGLYAATATLLLPSATVPTDEGVRALRDLATTMQTRQLFGMFVWSAVNQNRDMPRDTAARLLTEATASVDVVLKAQPNDVDALVTKSIVLRLRADRVEQNAARAGALRAEADKLAEQAKKQRAAGNRP
jgi:hypothetical protein